MQRPKYTKRDTLLTTVKSSKSTWKHSQPTSTRTFSDSGGILFEVETILMPKPGYIFASCLDIFILFLHLTFVIEYII
jgi:hypothetical protein